MLLEHFTWTVLHQHWQETKTLKPETHVITSIWSQDETQVATDLFFHIVMYFWVKGIIEEEKKRRVGTWFYSSVDWMVADLKELAVGCKKEMGFKLELSQFIDFSWFLKIVDFILFASINRQNTRSVAFHGRESNY